MTTRAPEHQPEESGHGVRIARVGGVPVYLAPSWFLIAAVIVAIVAPPYFPERPGAGIAIGVTQALLLLVSVLVHEAAHAVTARAFRMPVIRIVANVWGGHTSFEAGRSTPGRLAAIAAAGPAANAALAVAAWLFLLGASGHLTSALLSGLVIINGSLAVLNFLPGLPLDGGQVVESLVWKATGNRNRGSVVAGWCGRVLTVLLVLWFCVRPLAQGQQLGFDTIWVLLIGSVLWTGATQSIRRGQALSTIQRVRLGSVAKPLTVLPGATPVQVAIDLETHVVTLDDRGVPCLMLLDTGQELPAWAPLSSVVTRLPDQNVVEASPDDDVEAVVVAMQETGVGTVVLTNGGRAYAFVDGPALSAAFGHN
ncbi:site-2 protease family protein [Phycicoccus sp. Soil802]|uniref:site-2 protease family protein n=1 Tax=Phycicoccus sp. Soil802 TaxID=1736414 RepID=UPI0012F8D18E|nr:site-2 protease family protein [Phycicoccus sp. Soil802]